METRRGARITSNLWIAVDGVDLQPELRRGDLSATGMYFEIDRAVGEIGSVQRLQVETEDRRCAVAVLARIIRVVSADDLRRGKITVGAAFEFMPESTELRHALDDLVRQVVGSPLADETSRRINHHFDAKIDNLHQATIHRLGVRGMLLDTERPLAIGDTIQVAIQAPGTDRPIRIEAQTVSVEPMEGALFRVELQIHSERHDELDHPVVDDDDDSSSAMAERIDRLFADLMIPPATGAPPSRKEHLVGALSRIKLPSLLALFEMERMSGELQLNRDGDLARIYLSDGRVVDVVYPAGPEAPRAMIAALIQWDDGAFEFTLGPIERADRFETSTTGLLLDLAREHDEAAR